MLRLWIGRVLLWLLLPAQIEQAQRASARIARGGHRERFVPVLTDNWDKEPV
jgi:hypothetical protein